MPYVQPLTDNDLMPMGKDHKGKKLANVPAPYLIALYDKGWLDRYPALKAYVTANLDVMKKQSGQKQNTYK